MIAWDNESIAEKLLEYADLLEQQDANPYRVGAYRRAARVVATHPEPLTERSAREGAAGLDRLPAIGRSIAHAIEELIESGRCVYTYFGGSFIEVPHEEGAAGGE